MKYYFKPMLFFCLAIHVLTQNTHASAEEGFDHEPSKTIPFHFSHTKSPAIREMGYCQISIYNSVTKELYSFPLLNIHTRSPTTSPRDKSTSPPTEKRKFGSPLPKPHPQTYEHDYELPCKFLEPKNYLCLSFFIDSIYLGRHTKECTMRPWQDLENISLLELTEISKNKSGKRLISFSLNVDWNKEPPPLNLACFDRDRANLDELQSATTLRLYYK